MSYWPLQAATVAWQGAVAVAAPPLMSERCHRYSRATGSYVLLVLKQNADTATAAPQGARCCCCGTEPLPLLHCPHCCAAPTAALAPLLCCPRCCAATSAVLPPLLLPLPQEQLWHGTACNAAESHVPLLCYHPLAERRAAQSPRAAAVQWHGRRRCCSAVAAVIRGASAWHSTTAPAKHHLPELQAARRSCHRPAACTS